MHALFHARLPHYKRHATMNEKIRHEKGSGNVFRDLGLPGADTLQLRSSLAVEIFRILKRRKPTQKDIARMLGIDRSEVSRLKNGHYDQFSVERLLGFLNRLDRNIEIRI